MHPTATVKSVTARLAEELAIEEAQWLPLCGFSTRRHGALHRAIP